MEQNLTILYCGNDAMFEGIYLSILSIVRRCNKTFNFYIMSGDFSDKNEKYKIFSLEHIAILDKLVKKYNIESFVKLIDAKQEYLSKIGQIKLKIERFTPYTLFRLLLDKFDFLPKYVMYLDCDTMCNGDISEAFVEKIKDNEMIVCHDRFLKWMNKHTYFNAGVIYFNIEMIKTTNLLDKTIRYLVKHNPILLDQTALNKCWTKIDFWDDEYRFNCQEKKVYPNTVIKHFITVPTLNPRKHKIKQWQIDKVQNLLKIHAFDEDYKIFLEEKNKANWMPYFLMNCSIKENNCWEYSGSILKIW